MMMLGKSFSVKPWARCSTLTSMVKPLVKFPVDKGYTYDELEHGNSYKIRSLLNEMFENRVEVGFHMAFNRLLEAISCRDFVYLSQICHPKLCRVFQQSTPLGLQLHRTPLNCKDIVYSDMTIIIGEQNQMTPVKLSLFDVINVDIYPRAERIKIENCKLKLECYLLSQHCLTKPPLDESVYHRVMFETSILEEYSNSVDIISIMLASSKKRKKQLQNQLFGRKFEWQINEIDSFEQ